MIATMVAARRVGPTALLVALVACFHGYRAAKKEGAEGVGIATNRAIVHGAVLCIVLNLVISWILYG